MAAARAGSPYLGGDYTLGIKCLNLQLTTLIEIKARRAQASSAVFS